MKNNIFSNATFLVTGATGIIGQAIVKRLKKENTNIIAIVRDVKNAERILGKETQSFHYLVGDVTTIKPVNVNANFIIHAASQTSSKAFIDEPVETIMTSFVGTRNMLEFARINPIKSFVYLSTMEVYGNPITEEKIIETHECNLDVMKVRACYPESKRMCENLCVSYLSEYNVPAKVIRLTQTFGEGVKYDDKRVFAEFARCVIEERDIVLNTKGETKRNYLYTEDAVDAILTVLLRGENGSAYNAANEETYCSIYEMAYVVAKTCANNKIKVFVNDRNDYERRGYAPTLKMNLDVSKLKELGWRPKVGLAEMFTRMICDMKLHKK